MPILSMFYGIVIRLYFFDDKQHHVPHIHAEYAGQRAVFSIDDGQVLVGALPSGKTRLVQAWIETVSYTHLRAHETVLDLVCRLLLEKKKT